jgi:hypothetical protein
VLVIFFCGQKLPFCKKNLKKSNDMVKETFGKKSKKSPHFEEK